MSNYADNILDKDGNPIYLEDKHLNDQTSQTTVATTDAVMLKDTNGAYHSIAKASFNEAVRAAMGTILTNFDKGTSISRVIATDSSKDLGSITSANLASVLGGLQSSNLTYATDEKFAALRGKTQARKFTAYPSSGGLLSGNGSWGIIISIEAGDYCFQFAWFGEYQRAFMRGSTENRLKPWYKITMTEVG